jgi:hypothetical protein
LTLIDVAAYTATAMIMRNAPAIAIRFIQTPFAGVTSARGCRLREVAQL